MTLTPPTPEETRLALEAKRMGEHLAVAKRRGRYPIYFQGTVTAVNKVTTTPAYVAVDLLDADGNTIPSVTCVGCMPPVGSTAWVVETQPGQMICTGSVPGVTTSPPPFSARVYRTAAQNVAAAPATTLVLFNLEEYDTNANFSTGTSRWTCPFDGLYAVNSTVGVSMNNNPESNVMGVYKNAVEDSRGGAFTIRGAGAGDGMYMTVATEIYCLEGDLLDIRIIHSTGGNAIAIQVSQVACWATFRYLPL